MFKLLELFERLYHLDPVSNPIGYVQTLNLIVSLVVLFLRFKSHRVCSNQS